MSRSKVVAAPRPSRRRRLALALAASLAAVAGLLAYPGGARAATTAEATAANSVLRMLNAERAAHHLPALAYSPALISGARLHNVIMAQANLLSHQLPGEAVFSTRISQAGVPWNSGPASSRPMPCIRSGETTQLTVAVSPPITDTTR